MIEKNPKLYQRSPRGLVADASLEMYPPLVSDASPQMYPLRCLLLGAFSDVSFHVFFLSSLLPDVASKILGKLFGSHVGVLGITKTHNPPIRKIGFCDHLASDMLSIGKLEEVRLYVICSFVDACLQDVMTVMPCVDP